MNIISKVVVKKLHFPVDNVYNYSIQVVTSVDQGKTYWFAGNSFFARTEEEAIIKADGLKNEIGAVCVKRLYKEEAA